MNFRPFYLFFPTENYISCLSDHPTICFPPGFYSIHTQKRFDSTTQFDSHQNDSHQNSILFRLSACPPFRFKSIYCYFCSPCQHREVAEDREAALWAALARCEAARAADRREAEARGLLTRLAPPHPWGVGRDPASCGHPPRFLLGPHHLAAPLAAMARAADRREYVEALAADRLAGAEALAAVGRGQAPQAKP